MGKVSLCFEYLKKYMEKGTTELAGVLCVIIASVFWGTTGTSASYIPDVSSLAVGAFAMGIGGVLLVINAWQSLRQDVANLLRNRYLLIAGAACVAVYPLAFYSSMRLAGVAIGTLISIATAPFFTVLFERLISKRRISIQWIVSFAVGAIGIVMLTLGKVESIEALASSSPFLGGGLGLIAAFTYAGYSWVGKRLIEHDISSKSSMASMFGLAAVVLIPSLSITGENLLRDTTHISVMLYMAVVPMFMGYLLFGYGLRHISASKATLITLLEPAVATLFAVFLLGERFSVMGWFGLVLVSLCILLQVVKRPLFKSRLAADL